MEACLRDIGKKLTRPDHYYMDMFDGFDLDPESGRNVKQRSCPDSCDILNCDTCIRNITDLDLYFCKESLVCVLHCESTTHKHRNFHHLKSIKLRLVCETYCKRGGGYCMGDKYCYGNKCKGDSDVCMDHCTDINHSHCSELHCTSLKLCRETRKCRMHCNSKSHGHCSFRNCTDPIVFAPDGITVMCIKNCEFMGHSHCSNLGCSATTNICETTSQCAEHCEIPYHGHCFKKGCGETRNICRKDSICQKHCDSSDKHQHCQKIGCRSRVNICKSMRDRGKLMCVYHCYEDDHGHCDISGCDAPADSCRLVAGEAFLVPTNYAVNKLSRCTLHCEFRAQLTQTEQTDQTDQTDQIKPHCSHFECNSTTDICKTSMMCALHCNEKSHTHCVTYDCDSTQLCEITSKCKFHCFASKEKTGYGGHHHGHCMFPECDVTTHLCKEKLHCLDHCPCK